MRPISRKSYLLLLLLLVGGQSMEVTSSGEHRQLEAGKV